MIDPKLLRNATDDVAANLARRGVDFDAAHYLDLEERRKALQVQAELLRSQRNASAKSIGQAKAKGEDIKPLLAAVKDLGDQLDAVEAALEGVQQELNDIELGLPNLLADDVPDGRDESDNVEVRTWGTPAKHWTTSSWATRSGSSTLTRPRKCRVRVLPSCAARWHGCNAR